MSFSAEISVPLTHSVRATLSRDAKGRGVSLEVFAGEILEDYARKNATLEREFVEARRVVDQRLQRGARG